LARCIRCCLWITLFFCPSTGSLVAADEGWQFLNGPEGSFVRDLARAPSDPDILYAATWGDLYKSLDGGATWQPLGLEDAIASVAVHPQNSSIVLAGTDFGEIARTVDGGMTWVVQQPIAINNHPVRHLEIDPSAPDKAYALFVASNFAYPAPPILKTVDGGVTWTEASDGLLVQDDPPLYSTVSGLALDPQNPSLLYTMDLFSQLYSSEEGALWTRVPNIGVNSGGAAALAIDPGDSSHFFAGLFFGGVYRSQDGGIQWAPSGEGLPGFTQDFAFAPGDPPTLFGATLRGVYRSDNRAESWFPVDGGISNQAIATLLVDPSDSQHLHAGGEIGVFETTDGGSQWISRNEGMLHRWVHRVLVDRSEPSTVLAATRSDALHRSTDGGLTWPLNPIDGLTGRIASLVAAPSDPSRLYLGSSFGRVFRSSDHGVSWTEVEPAGGDLDTVTALAVHPSNPQIVYAGLTTPFSAGQTLLRSSNGGDSWTVSREGLADAPVLSLVVDPQDPSILYTGQRFGVAKSTDGGATWHYLASLGQSPFLDFQAVIDPRNSSTVYAIIQNSGIFRSTDGGDTWQAIHAGLPTPQIRTLVVDPDDSSVLYAAPAGHGVYRSPDRGESWSPFNDGFPEPGSAEINVHTLAVASSAPERRLYAGMFTPDVPSGVYGRSVPFPSLFTDGFESGDLSAWSLASPP